MRTKQFIITKIMPIGILALAGMLLFASTALAQAGNSSANTIRVSPVRTDITADPGETKTVKITVTNPTNQEIAVKPVQNDFTAKDESGSPALFIEEDQYAPKRSLKRLMQPLESVIVAAGESKTIDVTIAVPNDARAGGYFGAIRFTPVATADGGQVNMSASVASLILMRVSGDAAEKLSLTEFAVQQKGATGAFFTDSKDLSVTARFSNTGDVQLAPFGKISVQKGKTVVFEADFNAKNPRDMTLPDSARRWSIPLEKISGLGKYTVSATFTYGSNNQSIESTTSFWVVPWVYMLGGVATLLLVVGAIITWIIMHRKRKSKISLK